MEQLRLRLCSIFKLIVDTVLNEPIYSTLHIEILVTGPQLVSDEKN